MSYGIFPKGFGNGPFVMPDYLELQLTMARSHSGLAHPSYQQTAFSVTFFTVCHSWTLFTGINWRCNWKQKEEQKWNASMTCKQQPPKKTAVDAALPPFSIGPGWHLHIQECEERN